MSITNTRTIAQASAGGGLSWYAKLRAALCEAGRPDLAERIGYRGNDHAYDNAGKRIGVLPGGACPTFQFTATEDEWRLIARACSITQTGRPGWYLWSDDLMVDWARTLGRIV